MSSEFRITEADKQTMFWFKLEQHLQREIERYRLEMEKTFKSAGSFNDDVLRGLILANRRLLAKADEKIVITDEDAT